MERRLSLWKSRRISDLLDEASCIQQHLPVRVAQARNRASSEPSDTVFSKLVFEGKLNSAIRYLSEDSSNGVLGMNDRPVKGSAKTVQDLLLEKHPDPKIPPSTVLMDGDPLYLNPIVFERSTPDLIKDVGRRSTGAADQSVWP